MADFYATIGVQYSHEEHPTLGKQAHPNGYILVKGARDEGQARDVVQGLTGNHYAFIYDMNDPDHSSPEVLRFYYPLGAFLTVTLSWTPGHLGTEDQEEGETT